MCVCKFLLRIGSNWVGINKAISENSIIFKTEIPFILTKYYLLGLIYIGNLGQCDTILTDSNLCWHHIIERTRLFTQGNQGQYGKILPQISKGTKIDCLSFVYVPATSAAHNRLLFFFLLQLFTVLMKKTCAVKQSIFLDVYGYYTTFSITIIVKDK